MRQNIMIFGGILLFLFGLLFMLQGLGVFPYPASSFMIGSQTWVIRGGVMMAVGAILAAGGRVATKPKNKP